MDCGACRRPSRDGAPDPQQRDDPGQRLAPDGVLPGGRPAARKATSPVDYPTVTLARFMEEAGLELEDVYAGQRTWSDLQADAGLPVAPAGPKEPFLRRACGRQLHIDDSQRIDAYREILSQPAPPEPATLPNRERRLLRMLVASIVDKAAGKTMSLGEGCALLWLHPQVRAELLQLLDVLASRLEHLPRALKTHADVPLQVHARYSRIEILAALGVGDGATVAPWQTGVYWADGAGVDLLAFTLDKTSGQFSPTTRYRDYAISRELIHWESQSTTRADSETGLRYQRHAELGTSVDAVRAPPHQRPRVLLPRAGRRRQPRVRTADGDHMATAPPAAGRPVRSLRGGGRVGHLRLIPSYRRPERGPWCRFIGRRDGSSVPMGALGTLQPQRHGLPLPQEGQSPMREHREHPPPGSSRSHSSAASVRLTCT